MASRLSPEGETEKTFPTRRALQEFGAQEHGA